MALMYKKRPMGGAVYMSLYEVNLRRLDPLLEQFEGGWLSWSPRMFWAQIALATLMRFQGPEQARAPAKPTPFKSPPLWIQPPRIYFVPGHINYTPH